MANYDEHYVAFLDILGFKELVKKSARDDKTLIALINALHSADPRKDGEDAFDGSSVFSDSIILFARINVYGLASLITHVVEISERLAINGVLCRGAVTRGLLHVSQSQNQSVVFGPALVQAVELEGTSAKFPRVILSKEVYRDACQSPIISTPGTRSKNDHFILRDDDGAAYVNQFADIKFGLQSGDTDLRIAALSKLDLIAEMIKRNLQETMDAPHHFEKQRWFAGQYNVVQSSHGDKNKVINFYTADFNPPRL